MMQIHPAIRQFIEDKVEVKNLCLPYFYADVSDFGKIQEGYRYACSDSEVKNLTGINDGDWHSDWYVIASNGMGDPFFINCTEEALGFPVYYCEHGAGRWDAYKAADSIEAFSAILQKIRELENDKKAILDFLSQHTDMDCPLWTEVYVSIKEDDE